MSARHRPIAIGGRPGTDAPFVVEPMITSRKMNASAASIANAPTTETFFA